MRPLLPRRRQRGRAGGREGGRPGALRQRCGRPRPGSPSAVAMGCGCHELPDEGWAAPLPEQRARGGAGRRARRRQVRLWPRSAPRPRGRAGQGARKGRARAQRGARCGMLPSFSLFSPVGCFVLFSLLPLFQVLPAARRSSGGGAPRALPGGSDGAHAPTAAAAEHPRAPR